MSSDLPQAKKYAGKRKLRNFVLNRSVQMPFVSMAVLTSLAISTGLGYLILRQAETAQKILKEDAAVLGAEFVSEVTTQNWSIWLIAALAAIGISVVLAGYVIVMTHRVAGPLYKIGRYFDQMANGRFSVVTPLRKGDLLRSTYADFQRKYDLTRERLMDKLNHAKELAEGVQGNDEELANIQQKLARYEELLSR